MVLISSEAKVGLFVLVALIILGYMSFRVGEYGFGLKKGYPVNVVFDDATGLEKDASVQIAGVEVGRVESISLKDGKALVTLRILPSVKLEEDTEAKIKSYGILGDKYVDIVPGTRGETYITAGGDIIITEQQADIDKLLSNLMDASSALNRIITQNDERLNLMIANLGEASAEMRNTFSTLNNIMEKIDRGEGTIGQLVENRDTFDNLNQTLASLRDITSKINKGDGSLGKLVNDEDTVDNLNASLKSIEKSMDGIDRYVTKSEQFKTFLSYRGEYLFDGGDGKGYFDLTIRPKEDKFYVLGLVANPRGSLTVTDTSVGGAAAKRTETWERDKLLFTAQIGKRFKDIALRGGIFESTGGVGIDYFAFDDKLQITFEAFDFDSDRNAHLKTYAEYRLLKHIYLSAGWDDFISDQGRESPFVGLSIKFEDEDLKYLLGSIPIPK